MNEDFNGLAEIESTLDFYPDISAFINLHTAELSTLTRIKGTNDSSSGIDDRIRELNAEIDRLLDIRRMVEGWLPHLAKIERAVVRRRCIEGRSWTEVEAMLQVDGFDIGARQAQNVKTRAIQKIRDFTRKGV